MPLVKLRYNYGILSLDNTKTTEQVSQICSDEATGCFHHNFGRFALRATRKVVDIGGKSCIIPQILLEADFSGEVIYIANENDSCRTRAVLRHELQHFTIWKTAVENWLNETAVELKRLALQDVQDCNQKRCLFDIQDKSWQAATELNKKWSRISEMNNLRLDEVDHDNKAEFARAVCVPYSLKFYQ